jgi:hypothetical protein
MLGGMMMIDVAMIEEEVIGTERGEMNRDEEVIGGRANEDEVMKGDLRETEMPIGETATGETSLVDRLQSLLSINRLIKMSTLCLYMLSVTMGS